MGVGLFVMFDPDMNRPTEFTSNPDGRTVAAATAVLDAIAAAKGLSPFTRFIPDLEGFLANDPDLKGLLDDDSDFKELLGNGPPAGEPPELWFDPADGRTELSMLIEALRMEPAWADGQPEGWAGDVAECLERLRADVEAAGRAGARFSLSYT
ncbi:hypothetical protein [Fimbriiglobus ruber]|uniref:Uncharacterized protein n=1 Tax=Fimbriiglobus ruber TaxID=1908690 RepID=A0A225E8E2_9BACT|nr:hypothetical protein [Fimbriiglobus ruber]OWK45769.1 hypothetical protein FRUB_02100 [Fimbriiglobus ruber]